MAMTIMAMTVAGGDGAYTDDVGGKLRCRIIIMPAFFALASMPCEVANARQARGKNRESLASIGCGI